MVPRLTIRPGIIVDPSLVEDRRGRWRSHGGGVNAHASNQAQPEVEGKGERAKATVGGLGG